MHEPKRARPAAFPCYRQINSDFGGATVHCVVLADGCIVECGSDGYAERRAKLVAAAVNAANYSEADFKQSPASPLPLVTAPMEDEHE